MQWTEMQRTEMSGDVRQTKESERRGGDGDAHKARKRMRDQKESRSEKREERPEEEQKGRESPEGDT